MMKYPKEYLDEIKLRLKVSQVVSKVVQLKKKKDLPLVIKWNIIFKYNI